MRNVRVTRGCIASLLLAITCAAPPSAAEAVRIAVMAPDVEIVVGGACTEPVVASAAASSAFARRWPAAVATAAEAPEAGAPPGVWTPPAARDDTDALTQALELQGALADAIVAAEVAAASRELTLGRSGATLASATGASHAVFVRVRGGCAPESAVAMLIDLRDGKVLGHHASRSFDERADPQASAAALAGNLFRRIDLGDIAWVGDDTVADVPADDRRWAMDRYAQRLYRDPLRVDSPGLSAYLRGIACRLVPTGCEGLQLHVLRDPRARAIGHRNGLVVLHTGLLLRLRDEAELAYVIAHEAAHVRDDTEIDRNDLAASRRRELETDRAAIAAMATAGYDPAAPARYMRRLRAEAAAADFQEGDTHPTFEERIAALDAAAAALAAADRGCERWQTVLAPFRRAWLDDLVRHGGAAATRHLLEAAVAEARNEGDAAALADWTSALRAHRGRHDPPHPRAPSLPATAPGAPPASAPAGEMRRVLGLRLRTPMRWERDIAPGAELWTVDGTALNLMLIVAGVRPGEPMLRGASALGPRFGTGLGPEGICDRILSTLRRLGWVDPRASGLRRHDFGGVPGWRADLRAAGNGALHYRGTLAFALRDDRLTVVLWFAAEGHYYERDAASVAATIDGLRFADE